MFHTAGPRAALNSSRDKTEGQKGVLLHVNRCLDLVVFPPLFTVRVARLLEQRGHLQGSVMCAGRVGRTRPW